MRKRLNSTYGLLILIVYSKASMMNDDKLVIVNGISEIAKQYAVNVITVYNPISVALPASSSGEGT